MIDIRVFLRNEMISPEGSIAWFRTFYNYPAKFHKKQDDYSFKRFWNPPKERNTDLNSIHKWASEGEFIKYQSYLNGYKILLKYSNYYVIDIDKVEGSVEVGIDTILRELYEAYPIFKDYPYTTSRTKGYPHIYIPVSNLPKYSNQVDILKIKTKNLTLYGDLLKETGTVEKSIIFNYDENKKVNPIDWCLISDLFDIDKMNIQYEVEPTVYNEEEKNEIRLLHKKTVEYEDKRQDFELRAKFIDRILEEIIKKDKSFFGSRDNWMRLTFLIQYELGENGKDIWDFHCSKVPNYNLYENMKFWNTNIDRKVDNPLSIGTLYKWATDMKIDVKEIRKQVYIKTYIDLSDVELSRMYAEEIKEFIKYDEESQVIYIYDDNIKLWKTERSLLFAMSYFEPYLKPILKSYLDGIIEETDKAKKQKKNIEKCMGKIGTIKYQKTLWEKVRDLIRDNDFSKKLNSNPNLLAIDGNLVLDLSTGEVMPRTKEHYFSKIVNRRYDEYVDTTEFEDYVKTIFVDKEDKTDEELVSFIQKLFGYFLTGKIEHRKYYVFIGDGANGKTTFFNFFKKILGVWYKNGTESIVLRESDGQANTPELNSLFDCRLTMIEEVPSTKLLNSVRLKAITGDVEITGKNLFQIDTYSKTIYTKLGMIQNKMPKIDLITEKSLKDRICAIPFNARFIFTDLSRTEKELELYNKYRKDGENENKIKSLVETEMKRLEAFTSFKSDEEIQELRRKGKEIYNKIKNPTEEFLDKAFAWFVKGAIRSYTERFDENSSLPKACKEIIEDISDNNNYLKDFVEEYYDIINQDNYDNEWKGSDRNKSKFVNFREFNNGYKEFLRTNSINEKYTKQDVEKQIRNLLGNNAILTYKKMKYMNRLKPKSTRSDENEMLADDN